MKCSTNECESQAVAISKIGGKPKCIECAVKVTREFGVGQLTTMHNTFPWDEPVDITCRNCGNTITKFLLGLGNECPKCRGDLK